MTRRTGELMWALAAILAVAFDALAAGVLGAHAAGVRPQSPLRYVALGDSYSSGEGLPPYLHGTSRAGCHRSPIAFPRLLVLGGRTVTPAPFVACSGALTENIGRLGGSGRPQVDRKVTRTQLATLSSDAWRRVDLVTVTVGGNDAGFSDALAACSILACDRTDVGSQLLNRLDGARAKLSSTYSAIRRRAPNAMIVVLGYPQLFPGAGRAAVGCVQLIPRTRQHFLRWATARLETVIAQESGRAGVFFASVGDQFAGHEPCGRKADWLFGLRAGVVGGSYHPDAAGHRAYARRVSEFVSCLTAGGWRLRANGLPMNPAAGNVAPLRCSA